MNCVWGAPRRTTSGGWIERIPPRGDFLLWTGGKDGFAIESTDTNERREGSKGQRKKQYRSTTTGISPLPRTIVTDGPDQIASTFRLCGTRQSDDRPWAIRSKVSTDPGRYLCSEECLTYSIGIPEVRRIGSQTSVHSSVMSLRWESTIQDLNKVDAKYIQAFVSDVLESWYSSARTSFFRHERHFRSSRRSRHKKATDVEETDSPLLHDMVESGHRRLWKRSSTNGPSFNPSTAAGSIETLTLKPFLASQTEAHRPIDQPARRKFR